MEENLFEIIKDFSREKGLDHEVVIKLVEESLIQAAQRKLPYREIEGNIDENSGKINLFHFIQNYDERKKMKRYKEYKKNILI